MKTEISRRSFVRQTPLLVLSAFVLLHSAASAAETSDLKQYNLGADKLAIQGFDPVAYMAQGKAVKGSKENSATHAGVAYWFSSAQNKALFVASSMNSRTVGPPT